MCSRFGTITARIGHGWATSCRRRKFRSLAWQSKLFLHARSGTVYDNVASKRGSEETSQTETSKPEATTPKTSFGKAWSRRLNLDPNLQFRTPRQALEDLLFQKYLYSDAGKHSSVLSLSMGPVPDGGLSPEDWRMYEEDAFDLVIKLSKTSLPSILTHIFLKYKLHQAAMSYLRFIVKEKRQVRLLTAGYLIGAIQSEPSITTAEADHSVLSEFIEDTLSADILEMQSFHSLTKAVVDTPRWHRLVPLYLRLQPRVTPSGTEVGVAAMLVERALLQGDTESVSLVVHSLAERFCQSSLENPCLASPLNSVLGLLLKAALKEAEEEGGEGESRGLFRMFLEAVESGGLLLNWATADLLLAGGSSLGYEAKATYLTTPESGIDPLLADTFQPLCASCSCPAPQLTFTPAQLSEVQRDLEHLLTERNPFDAQGPNDFSKLVRCLGLKGSRQDSHSSQNASQSPLLAKSQEPGGISGRVDYVVDGLNVAAHSIGVAVRDYNHPLTFSQEQLSDFLSYVCLTMGKRVLVVGKMNLSRLILPELKRSDNLQIFCSNTNTSSDDLFALYAAVSIPGCQLVSNDFFSDHVALMPQHTKHMLIQWQRRSQLGFAGIRPSGEPWLTAHDTWEGTPHCVTKGWHLPMGFEDAEDQAVYASSVRLQSNVKAAPGQPPNRWLCLQGL